MRAATSAPEASLGVDPHAGEPSPYGARPGPGSPRRWVGLAAAGIVLLAIATRAWVAWRGYFYLDDFAFMAKAAGHSPYDFAYLVEPYNSHLMPGSYLWVWLLTRAAPFNYGAVVVVTMILQTLLAVLFYTLLRRLFGATAAILVPLAVFVLTPVTLPATLWWSAAINQVPQQLAMVAALLAHTAYLRTGELRRGLLGALALGAGLLFSEKTLLALPLVAGLTVLLFTTGGAVVRLRTAVVRHRWVWLGYAAIAVPYVAYYALHVPSPARPPGKGSSVAQLVMESFVRAVVPGLLGGPWHWVQIGYAGALADPGPFACAVTLVIAGLVVGGSCLVHRHAWRGWALALGYALLNLALLTISRAAFIGPVIADEYRYVTDVALVFALGLGLATIPLAGHWRTGPVTRLRPRESWRAWLRQPAVRELRDELPRIRGGVMAGAAVVALAASATWSTLAYDPFWRVNPARAYVETARAQLAGSEGRVVLADAYVPANVAWALLGPYATVGKLLSPLRHPPRTVAEGAASDSLWMLDGQGRLHRAAIAGINASPGPSRGCGWRLGEQRVEIPLDKTTLPFRWTLRIGYISSAPTRGVVTVGHTHTPVSFHQGLGAVYLVADGAIDRVTVSPLTGGAVVCTDEVTVGAPTPTDGKGS